jgi:hypothetical protein
MPGDPARSIATSSRSGGSIRGALRVDYPVLDLRAEKPPFRAQAEGWEFAALGEPVNRALMTSEVPRDFVQSHHRFATRYLVLSVQIRFLL